ncbi:MAG: glycoside hydrolase family 2 TIM barrel-domain containing protein [Ferruginibacter sp.]
MKKFFLAAATFCCMAVSAQRVTQNFNSNWQFKLDSTADYSTATAFAGWRSISLPHDWSVELPFDQTSPTGTGGGALRGGMGWYSKTFTVPATEKDKQFTILFEGVYCRSTVFINGKKVGYRPNGYISFNYAITPYLQFGKPNTIVVKVNNNQQPNSRWYSGSGIYRNVWLIKTNKIHVDTWGSFVTTPEISKTSATVRVETRLAGAATNSNIRFITKITDANNKLVATATANTAAVTAQEIVVQNPVLWSLENPYLYKATTTVLSNGKALDEYSTRFGIRYFKFDAANGFFLNDKYVKIRGVCNHHDLGCLGTAFNLRAAERQIEILKSMGCNAIRTSHNPPAPGLLDLCDKHGMLVMDEAFDMWEKEKNPFDYHLEFNEWSKIDLETQIKRDRNHPSVIIWSMGNEIYEQWWKDGEARSEEILNTLHETITNLDKTRPTVTANNYTDARNRLLKPGVAELVGYNYHHNEWGDSVLKKWNDKPFIITESVSALQTRGHYDMPSDSIRRWPVRWDKPLTEGNPDTTCSAYENCSAPWGSTHEETLKVFESNKHISGMFIWTGFDYIGEPTPYDWPARSSYFGIMDLAGFPKDCYYLYKSIWTSEPVLHVFPHWNEQAGPHGWKKGDSVDIWVYYNNADKVELFVNGKSIGAKQKKNDDLHIMWRVQYEPGSIKAVSTKNDKTVLTRQINTAGPAYKIELLADHKKIKANGEDLGFVTIHVLDKNNNLVPHAANLVQFEISGSGFIAGVDNGSETNMESFKDNKRKAFNGKALVVLQNNGKKGAITLKATAAGLQSATVTIKAE